MLPHLGQPGLGEVAPIFEHDVSAARRLRDLVRGCRPVALEQGDVLYMPAGVVHRARAAPNSDSLHVTVSVARTHHHYAWAGLLADMLEAARSAAGKRTASARRVANDRRFVPWLHSVAASDAASGGGELALTPRCFHTAAQWNAILGAPEAGDVSLAAALQSDSAQSDGELQLRKSALESKTGRAVPLLEAGIEEANGDIETAQAEGDWDRAEQLHAKLVSVQNDLAELRRQDTEALAQLEASHRTATATRRAAHEAARRELQLKHDAALASLQARQAKVLELDPDGAVIAYKDMMQKQARTPT